MFELASIWILRDLLLMLLVPGGARSTAVSSVPSLLAILGSGSLLVALIDVFVFFLVKNGVLLALWRGVIYRLGIEQHEFSVRLFALYLRMPYLRFINRSKMTLQQNLNVAISNMFIFSVLPFMQLAVEAIIVCSVLAVLLVVSPIATLALLVWILLVFAVSRVTIDNSSRKAGVLQRESLNQTLRTAHDALRDIKTIRLWGREDFFTDLFSRVSAPFAHAWSQARFMQQMPRFTIEPVLIGALVAFAMALTLSGASTHRLLVDLSIFAAAGVRLLPAANRSVSLLHTIAFYRADLEAVWAEASQAIEQLDSGPDAVLTSPFDQSVALEEVEAHYGNSDKPVLHGVNLTIARGEKVVIVGASGKGKTTLLNVLLGFVPLSRGRILFDGHEDRPLTRFRRSSVSFVPQTVILLDNSIFANIAFGSTADDADEARVWECLHIADFAEHVRSMPGGLHARIGEDGVKLSGGERQRLALARALYRTPSFLVLDEATSQIGLDTERVIFERLMQAMPELTIVMATHRPETVAVFPRRFLVAGGVVRDVSEDPIPFRA